MLPGYWEGEHPLNLISPECCTGLPTLLRAAPRGSEGDELRGLHVQGGVWSGESKAWSRPLPAFYILLSLLVLGGSICRLSEIFLP